MQRLLLTALVICVPFGLTTFAEDGQPTQPSQHADDTSTLRLFFPPLLKSDSTWAQRVAKVYVNNQYAGDVILNQPGHTPTLRFEKGMHRIRVGLEQYRPFQADVRILGHGSVQYLFVDFDKANRDAEQTSGSKSLTLQEASPKSRF